ncbi:hypothetical protein ACFSOZ_23660 [Mesorhizobium newzealandense]|uniref:DUF4263 domain-containing protein n=1 Tax=Mesorhizobium newzealandense TaxID=1300302 RepID=A0ABW4UH34_9HYPH
MPDLFGIRISAFRGLALQAIPSSFTVARSSELYRIKALNLQHKLESYGIKGVVLAGTIPDTERKRSFELYRNSLSGLSIITFDELLAKLKSLRKLLSAKSA